MRDLGLRFTVLHVSPTGVGPKKGVEHLIAAVFYDIFSVIKFCFGLGALFGLMGIWLLLLWFFLRIIARYTLCGQRADRYSPLRKLFLNL